MAVAIISSEKRESLLIKRASKRVDGLKEIGRSESGRKQVEWVLRVCDEGVVFGKIRGCVGLLSDA